MSAKTVNAAFSRVIRSLRHLRRVAARAFSKDPGVRSQTMAFASEPWAVDRVTITDHTFRVEGWAFPPAALFAKRRPRFHLNGKPFDHAEVETFRTDVAAKFWRRDEALLSGFNCSAAISRDALYPQGFLEISYVNSTSAPCPSFYLADPGKEPPLPSREQRYRVMGNEDEFGFKLTGATDFNRLSVAIRSVLGIDPKSIPRVLDWGVGCGRVARYGSGSLGREFFGCDVDTENIAWCASHLPGEYTQCRMHPPLPYSDEQFDLVYGISVLTHLREGLQDAWLAELSRVLRPGGFALVTTHGQTTVDYAVLTPDEFLKLQSAIAQDGLFVSGKNNQLDGAVDGADEYVNVYHDVAYVREHWSRWFEIVAVLPGYIHTHDLIVMKRPEIRRDNRG